MLLQLFDFNENLANLIQSIQQDLLTQYQKVAMVTKVAIAIIKANNENLTCNINISHSDTISLSSE